MAAFNALSVFTYSDLIDKVYEFKKKYHNDQRYWVESLQLDTSYLRWPTHLSVKILEPQHKKLILEAAKKSIILRYERYSNDHTWIFRHSDTKNKKNL